MKIWTLIVLFFVVQHNLTSQVALQSLDDAYRLLESQHSKVKLAAAQSEELINEIGIQRAGMWPTVRLNSNADYNLNLPVQLIPAEIFGGPAGTFQRVQFGQPWVLGAGVDIQWPIVQIEKWRDIQSARIAATQGPLREKLELEQLKSTVLQRYYQALFWEAYYPYLTELRSQADSLYRVAEDKKSQSIISAFDLNRVEALRQQIYQQIVDATHQKEIAYLQLKASLQIPEDQDIVITDSLNQMLLTIPPSSDASQRPGVQLAQAQKDWSIAKIEARKAGLYPTLSAVGRYQFQWQSGDLFDGNQYIGFDYGTVGLSLQWQIFSGGMKNRQIEKANIQLKQSQHQYDHTLSEANYQIAQWTSAFNEAQANFEITSRRFELTQSNLELALLRLNEGYSPLDEYFQVYQDYSSAAQAFFQNRLNLHLYHALLQL